MKFADTMRNRRGDLRAAPLEEFVSNTRKLIESTSLKRVSRNKVRQTWKNTLRRAAEVLRSEGAQSLWFRVLGETVYRRMILIERLFSEAIIEAQAAVPVTVTLLKVSELGEYLQSRPGTDPAEIRSRLDRGYKCFVARHEEAIASACWAATGNVRIDYLGCVIQLADDEVYYYESYTIPRFRNLNIASVLGNEMVRQLRELDYYRCVAVLMPENRLGFRPIEKIGYRPFGIIGYVGLGGWRHYFCRVLSPSRPILIRNGDT